MKKTLVLVALATVMIGITGCDKDGADYKETYTLRFNSELLGEDLNAVADAYQGIAGISGDAEDESVVINGKDSTDCASQFLQRMAKAETLLASQTSWESAVYVAAWDSKNSLVYSKAWGENGSNGQARYVAKSLWKNSTSIDAVAEKGKYIKEYYVDTFKHYWGHNALGKDVWISIDLNSFAYGRYILLSAEPTDNIEEAVTGAFILKSDKGGMPKTITYKGVEYTCSSELDGDPLPNYRNRDLNEGAGGKYLFLYTTHDKSLKRALLWGYYTCYYDSGLTQYSYAEDCTLSPFIRNGGPVTVIGDEVEFMPGTTLVKDEKDLENLQLQYRDVDRNMNRGQDMNEGAGGAFIYVLQQWEKR